MPSLRAPPWTEPQQPCEICGWLELALSQGKLTPGIMEEGACFALHDRDCIAQEWSEVSRRVFVVRWNESSVAIYDSLGEIIDDAANFTPNGQQPFSPSDGDNSFQSEWTDDSGCSYYHVPMIEDKVEPDAELETRAADESTPRKAVEGEREEWEEDGVECTEGADKGGEGLHDEGGGMADIIEKGEKLKKLNEQRELFVPGARMWCKHHASRLKATVCMRKPAEPHDVVVLVLDSELVQPQWIKLELSDDTLESCEESSLVLPADDDPVSDRAVGVMFARSGKEAEGYFYGAFYCGHNGSLLAPTAYKAITPALASARFPRDISQGDSITFADRNDEWALLHFVIAIEAGQCRFLHCLATQKHCCRRPHSSIDLQSSL
jgi:hypothetical protein